MATQIEILPIPIILTLLVVGIVLMVMGFLKRNVRLTYSGSILLGLTTFAAAMAFYLDIATDEWESHELTANDVFYLGTVSFLAGLATAYGLVLFLTRKA